MPVRLIAARSVCGVAIAQVGPEAERSMAARLPAERQAAISVREANLAQQRRPRVVARRSPVGIQLKSRGRELWDVWRDVSFWDLCHQRGWDECPPRDE